MRLEKVLMKPQSQINRYCKKCRKKMVEQMAEVKWFLQGNLEVTKYLQTKLLFCESSGCLYGLVYFEDAKRVDDQNRVWIVSHDPKLFRLLSYNKKQLQTDSGYIQSRYQKKKQRRISKNRQSRIFDSAGRFLPDSNLKKKYDWGEDQ